MERARLVLFLGALALAAGNGCGKGGGPARSGIGRLSVAGPWYWAIIAVQDVARLPRRLWPMFRLTLPLGSRLDSEMREIVRGATASLALKVLGAVLTFFFNLVLARMLGAQEAGLYFLAFTVATVVLLSTCCPAVRPVIVRHPLAVAISATATASVLNVVLIALLLSFGSCDPESRVTRTGLAVLTGAARTHAQLIVNFAYA